MNTNDHICKQAMSILRKQQMEVHVEPNDIAFLKRHMAKCKSCLADSAVVRGMIDAQNEPRFDELTARRRTDDILAAVSQAAKKEENTFTISNHRRWLVPIAAAATLTLVLGYVMLSSPAVDKQLGESPQLASSQKVVSSPMVVSSESVKQQSAAQLPPRENTTAVPQKMLPTVETNTAAKNVVLPTGIRLIVHPESELKLRRSDNEDITVTLDKGKLLASVDPFRNGPPFSVETGLGRVTVTGTIFSVAADGVDDYVSVIKGQVMVTDQSGTARLVNAGEKRTLNGKQSTSLPLDRVNTMSQEADMLASLKVTKDKYVDWRWDKHQPLQPCDKIEAPFKTAEPEALQETLQEKIQEKILQTPTRSKSITPGIKELLLIIRKYRLNRDWHRASQAYEKLITKYPASNEAAAALVALGDLQLNKLGHPRVALSLFDRYLRQKDMTVIEEALIGKAAALKMLGRYDQEQNVLVDFLKRYPKSVHGAMVRTRLAMLRKMQKQGGPNPNMAGTQ